MAQDYQLPPVQLSRENAEVERLRIRSERMELVARAFETLAGPGTPRQSRRGSVQKMDRLVAHAAWVRLQGTVSAHPSIPQTLCVLSRL